MGVTIITDSGCELTQKQAEANNIILVPMTVHFGSEEYHSGIDLTSEDFYRKLAAAKELPTTSQPTPYQFASVYAQVKQRGDEAVVLCISSALSGTYQSAMIAAQEYEDCVHVIDTRAVSVAQKILLEYALQLRSQGLGAKQITQLLEAKKADIRAFGVVETLDYLIKGGRLSKAAGAVGSVLGIRPVLTLQDGQLAVAGKARGTKGAIAMTNQQISEIGVDFSMPAAIGYTGTDPSVIDPFICAEDSVWSGQNISICNVGSTVGTHTGPGLFICAFFKKS